MLVTALNGAKYFGGLRLDRVALIGVAPVNVSLQNALNKLNGLTGYFADSTLLGFTP